VADAAGRAVPAACPISRMITSFIMREAHKAPVQNHATIYG